MGIKEPSSISANVGNAAHKALEIRARAKLAQQQGLTEFVEPENNLTLRVDDGMYHPHAISIGWSTYFKDEPESGPNFNKVQKLVEAVINSKLYDPARLEILEPEKYFDIPLDEYDWAKFEFVNPHTGLTEQATLHIKGTVDLITIEDDGLLHYQDYKTGRKWSWSDNCEKTYESLMSDSQLLLYHFALKKMYPDKDILMTIYYAGVDGPTTLPYGEAQLKEFVGYLKEEFLDMQACQIPNRKVKNGNFRAQPCSFCSYSKTKVEGTDLNQCDFYHREILSKGMDAVIKEHGDPKAFGSYSGGGRINLT